MSRRKIIDAFIFYNELDLLECRLRELWDVVDVFVLAEGSTTFRGKPKTLNFADNKARFAPYMSKIVPVVANLHDIEGSWAREHALRNSLTSPISTLGLADDDICILSDVDEIPDSATLSELRSRGVNAMSALDQDFFYYNLTCRCVNVRWSSSRVMPARVAISTPMQIVRDHVPAQEHVIQRGGWHLSKFMPASQIVHNILAGGHPESDPENGAWRHLLTVEAMDQRIRDCVDVIDRVELRFERISVEDNAYLPHDPMFKQLFGMPIQSQMNRIDHFYKSIPGHFTFPDFYAWLAHEVPDGAHLVEVGVFAGQSAAFLAVELHNAGKTGCRVDLVDLFDASLAVPACPASNVVKSLQPVKHIIGTLHAGISWEIAKHYEDASLDAVFIDADHEYSSVRKDIDAWLPKVKPGGILAGHDYMPLIPGVIQAVDESFPNRKLWPGESFQNTGTFYPVWEVRVPRKS